MSPHFGTSLLIVGVVCGLIGSPAASAQSSQAPTQGPVFLAAAWFPDSQLLQATGAPVLHRRVSLGAADSTVDAALKQVIRQADLEILYSGYVVPLNHPVMIEAREITVAAALSHILSGLAVDVSITPSGAVALVPHSPRSPPDTGWITGRVTDSATAAPLAGATIAIDGLAWMTETDAIGSYRLSGLAPGEYTVRARYIGYAPGRRVVTVHSNEEAVGDFTLVKLPQELDQLVVTGTIVPTDVKALPTPVTVVTEEDIAVQRPQNLQELFRRAVPGSVGWDYTAAPYQTSLSVRGASSINTTAASMKVFIDGIDAAVAGYSQVDPNSIARVEVIRGPQAAAIYGSEAIGGVVQVFTKRGDPQVSQPQVHAEGSVGAVQTPYAGYESVLQQDYKASVRGGTMDVGYSFGAGYTHLEDWLPNDEVSRQSNPSVYAGINVDRPTIGLDVTGRYYVQDLGSNLLNPELMNTGFPPYSQPSYQPVQTQNQTVGARLRVAPTDWMHAALNVGFDRFGYDLEQTRPRYTTAADSLLLVANEVTTKTSVGLSVSFNAPVAKDITSSVTVGADHWSRLLSSWYALEALGTTGTISTAPSGTVSATRTPTDNTGVFSQVQVGVADALFLTLGLRGEANTNFGDSLGIQVLPRVGLAYARPVGATTLKLRGSWGRAIVPPGTGRKNGFVSAVAIQLPNPFLGPERQQGWDLGIETTFGTRASLSLTYFDQDATNLADAVVLAVEPVLTRQYQNVGSIANSGLEFEGRFRVGIASVQAQFAHTRSRIQQLSPTYEGDLQVGDEPPLTPAYTAGVSVTASPRSGTTIAAGATYVGEWTNVDYLALFSCLGGTGPCQPTFRDYHTTYPSFMKANLAVWQRVTPVLEAFLSVHNLTNSLAYEGTNVTPVRGRTTTAGIRLQYGAGQR